MLCFPSQMQIYLYNSDDFDSLSAAIKERRIIAAMAVFFEVKYLKVKINVIEENQDNTGALRHTHRHFYPCRQLALREDKVGLSVHYFGPD